MPGTGSQLDNRWRRLGLVGGGIAALLAADRWLKIVAIEHLLGREPANLLWGTVRLVYQENHGGMLSLGAALPESIRFLFFTVLVVLLLALLLLVAIVKRSLRTTDAIAAACIVGGGLGNVIDRVIYDGAVVDYITMGFGSVRTGVFNLADLAIIVGAAVYLFGRRGVASQS